MKVLATTRLPDEIRSAIPAGLDLVEGPDLFTPLSRQEVLARIHDVEVVLNQNELIIDQELLAAAPALKLVANATAGFNNMDLAAMQARGVAGTNCPRSFASATADHTLCLLLATARKLIAADAYTRSGAWAHEGWTPGRWDGISLEGRILGIVGYGHIGRQVAQRAAAFGMIIRHCDEMARDEPGFIPFDRLLAEADVLTLHCPLTPQTHHLINADSLSRMKRGAMVLNVSRGPVVDIMALIAALQSGQIASAGLDVFEEEPLVPEELFGMTNVVLTPHIGGGTVESKHSAWTVCLDNVARFQRGEALATPIQPAA